MTSLGVLAQLFSAYPNTATTEETILVYARLLADIPAELLQTVVDQAIVDSKFLPTVAELRDMYRSLTLPKLLPWTDAWSNVQAEMRRVGSYSAPQFSDELTTRVIKAMGWRTLCASENPSIDRAQFRDMYNALAERKEGEQKLLPQARELAAQANGGLLPMAQIVGKLTKKP